MVVVVVVVALAERIEGKNLYIKYHTVSKNVIGITLANCMYIEREIPPPYPIACGINHGVDQRSNAALLKFLFKKSRFIIQQWFLSLLHHAIEYIPIFVQLSQEVHNSIVVWLLYRTSTTACHCKMQWSLVAYPLFRSSTISIHVCVCMYAYTVEYIYRVFSRLTNK